MSTNNPWKTISINEVYDNNWINITHRKVINPSGQNGIYGKVHFKNIAVGVLPLDHENNTWLVGQYRYTLGEYSWEIPEGGCINSIEPLQAAKNELKEESAVGFTCFMDTVLRASSFENNSKKILIPFDTKDNIKKNLRKLKT